MNGHLHKRILKLNTNTETSKNLCPVCLRIMERKDINYHNCFMEMTVRRLTSNHQLERKIDEFGSIVSAASYNYRETFKLMGIFLRRSLNRDTTRIILLYLFKSKNDHLLWYSEKQHQIKRKESKNGRKQ